WPFSDRHRLELALHAASLPSHNTIAPSGANIAQDHMDLPVSAARLSRLGAGVRNELRTSITTSERAAGDDEDALPFATFSQDGLAFGNRAVWASARDAHVRISDALHLRTGAHALKLGAAVTLSGYEYTPPEQEFGSYAFGSVDELAGGTGVLVRTEGVGTPPDWTDRTLALFVQDRFTIARDVEVMAGIRAERQTLAESVGLDEQWQQLTGIASNEVDEPGVR